MIYASVAQSDLLNSIPDPLALGLPPATGNRLPKCDQRCSGKGICSLLVRQVFNANPLDLLEDLAAKQPLWPPKQKSTYSNVNFDLLGLVIENVTDTSYTDYVEQSILSPLGMNGSSFIAPNDSVAVLPKGGNYWEFELGVQRP